MLYIIPGGQIGEICIKHGGGGGTEKKLKKEKKKIFQAKVPKKQAKT